MARIKGMRLRMKTKRSKSSAKKQLKKMNRIWKSKLTNAPISPAPAPSPISEPLQDLSSASATDTTGAPGQAMNNSDSIPGFIFLCNRRTKPKCFQYQVFGLPVGQKETVEKIKPGTKLFLFDYGMRLLHGVYEAASEGQLHLVPHAFDGNYLAQVKFRIVKECLPLPERYFKSAILENYYAGKLRLELSKQQVNTLVSLFRPLSSSTSSDLVDLSLPNAALPQLALLPQRIEDQHPKNLNRVHSQQTVDPQPIQPVQVMQHQQTTGGALVDHVHPSFHLQPQQTTAGASVDHVHPIFHVQHQQTVGGAFVDHVHPSFHLQPQQTTAGASVDHVHPIFHVQHQQTTDGAFVDHVDPGSHLHHQQITAGAFVDHVHPSFHLQHHSIPNPSDLYNAHTQELYSTGGHTLVVQEPYPRYIPEQEWLPQNHIVGLGNDYHLWPLMGEPLQQGHFPHPQEIDAWYHHQLPFLMENAVNGESFAAYTSVAGNHNIFTAMQPHAPAYGSPELPYVVSGPYVSSTVQPLPLAFGVPEQTYSDPYFSSIMQPYAPEDGRSQPNYPWPPYVSTAVQAYVPASASWPEENYPLPAATYAPSMIPPYVQAPGWPEPNHPLPAVPYVTMQPHATSSGIPVPNVPMSSHFSFLGANQFIN